MALGLAVLPAAAGTRGSHPGGKVQFGRDIRPILAEHCFRCHGPDKGGRKDSELRLDTPEGMRADLGGSAAVVPGHPEKSELIARVTTTNEQDRMPFEREPLTGPEIALLRDWIAQGAEWEEHWAFTPPERPQIPHTRHAARVRNEIDHFVLARLEVEGLTPPPPANKATLLRRVSLDLTGLPPSDEERDLFLADTSANAYEKVVDRLLASPQYGEHFASFWLNAARYSDSNGDGLDTHRMMWPWRDWVVRAFNRNLPFDQFTIEQLAGDLLPDPTLDQLTATGFNRNHRGGSDVLGEMTRLEYVADRAETVATTWLGLTLACARCHDHKYDPIAQKDYYRLMAYFNHLPEKAKLVTTGFGSRVYNSPPFIKTPTPEQSLDAFRLDAKASLAQLRFDALEARILEAKEAWEAGEKGKHTPDWTVPHGQLARYTFEPDEQPLWASAARSQKSTTPPAVPAFGPGKFGAAIQLDGRSAYVMPDVPGEAPRATFKHPDGDVQIHAFMKRMEGDTPYSVSLWVDPRSDGPLYSHATNSCERRGVTIMVKSGQLHVMVVGRWPDELIRFHTVEHLPMERWSHIAMTFDASREGRGVKLYINGELAPRVVDWDEFTTATTNKDPVRLGYYPPNDAGFATSFTGKIDELIFFDRVLSQTEVDILAAGTTTAQILAKPLAERTRGERAKLDHQFLEAGSPPAIRQAFLELREAREALEAYRIQLPTTMVMADMTDPRKTFVMARGEFDHPKEQVQAGAPAFLETGRRAGASRLDLARWIVGADDPLAARVAVSRLWQVLFGTGLVRTSEDFGTQGEWPAQGELLDWLATEFVRRKWDVKSILKLIVMSGTYQASSAASPELVRCDPYNRLLARGPRMRMTAQMIRDQALAASGLLVRKVGGPPVMPFQPAGFWSVNNIVQEYVPEKGEGSRRRSLYTFWKRTAPPPAMTVLDAPYRDSCRVKEERTNSPLQALVLLNEPTFLDAARALANQALKKEGSEEARIRFLLRRMLVREPERREVDILRRHLATQRAHYVEERDLALSLLPSDALAAASAPEMGAWTSAALLALNLDETITKE